MCQVPKVGEEMAHGVSGEEQRGKEKPRMRVSARVQRALDPLQRQGQKHLHADESEQRSGEYIAWVMGAQI